VNVEQKTFYKMLLEIGKNPGKANRILSDKRLSALEKKIIEAHLLIRDNRNVEAFELLSKTPPSESVFVEAQKKFVCGIALINQSRLAEAEPLLTDFTKVMYLMSFNHFVFIGYFNLFVLNSNRGNLSRMEECLQKMLALPSLSSDHQIKLLRCQFMYHFETANLEQANEYLHLLKLRKNELTENDQISLLVSEFKFNVKKDDWSKCNSVLTEMKKFRKFQLKGNFKFMKLLLDHLTKGSPIYSYDKDLKDTPLLFHQLKVIQHLEAGEMKKAENHWLELEAITPEIYGSNFRYHGSKTIFSACIDKHRQKTNGLSDFDIKLEKSKIDRLIAILTNVEIPISKDRLFEMIWGHLPADKNDQKKLVRLIYEAKTEHGLNICYHKGTYFTADEEESSKLKKPA